MEDFINTSFNELLSTLETPLPIQEQNPFGIDPFGPLGLDPNFSDFFEGEGEADTAVNPNA
tara:strand:+ start:389 stop:571 length:183 start_codon:yes stop_codon:yes gene_type:complete